MITICKVKRIKIGTTGGEDTEGFFKGLSYIFGICIELLAVLEGMQYSQISITVKVISLKKVIRVVFLIHRW